MILLPCGSKKMLKRLKISINKALNGAESTQLADPYVQLADPQLRNNVLDGYMVKTELRDQKNAEYKIFV